MWHIGLVDRFALLVEIMKIFIVLMNISIYFMLNLCSF